MGCLVFMVVCLLFLAYHEWNHGDDSEAALGFFLIALVVMHMIYEEFIES